MEKNQHCPCGSNEEFERCCRPYLMGIKYASKPELLMRSRYSAYATKYYDYIVETQAPAQAKTHEFALGNDSKASQSKNLSVTEVERESAHTLWCKLEVLNAFEKNDEGEVEFIAYYKANNEFFAMHELSRFQKLGGRWFYVNGDMLHKSGVVKPSRNESCLCGSGKKFKRCCLVADT